MPEPVFLVAFVVLGAVAGLLAGLFGVGGGGVTVPVLTSLFLAMGTGDERAVKLALGTSFAAMCATSFVSLRAHRRLGNVLPRVVFAMVPAIIVGTFAATFVAARAPSRGIAVFFALFMGTVAVRMAMSRARPAAERPTSSALFAAVGVGIGAVSALVSIGGGSLTVPFLASRGIDLRRAVGTSAAIGFPIAVVGTVGYAVNGVLVQTQVLSATVGFVHLPAALLVALGSVLLAPVGARLATRWPVERLRVAFAGLLFVLALKMALTAL